MTANLKATEIVDAIRARITGASLSLSPVIVQHGGLEFFVESETPLDQVPAVFVKARRILPRHGDLGAFTLEADYSVRVVVVNSWSDATEVVAQRERDAQEVAQVLIGTAGDFLELGVAGLDYSRLFVRGIDLEPEENFPLSLQGDRQLYAVAIENEVNTRANRPT